MAYPEPANVAPWYLRNITQALALNESTGNVYVRTDAEVQIANVGNLVISNVGINCTGNAHVTVYCDASATIDNGNIAGNAS